MNGRIYDPLLGRFLSADLIVQFPGSLQSYNRYSYIMNNPLIGVDKSGFDIVYAIWITKKGDIGHSTSAVQRQPNLIDGGKATRYTFREFGPRESIGGKKGGDILKDVKGQFFEKQNGVTLNRIMNSNDANENRITQYDPNKPDAVVVVRCGPEIDAKFEGGLDAFRKEGSTFNAADRNCTDYQMAGTAAAFGAELSADEAVAGKTVATPNKLFQLVKGLPGAEVVVDPGDAANKTTEEAYDAGKKEEKKNESDTETTENRSTNSESENNGTTTDIDYRFFQ